MYAQMTGNRSLWVSQSLVLLEKASLCFAWWIDRRAAKFQRMGTPIIANDFVPMHPLPSYDTPPLYCKQASEELLQEVGRDLKRYRKLIYTYIKESHFMAAAHISHTLLQQIRQMEKAHQCHFAMTCHLIESIGFAALHAPQYAEASHGGTISLSQAFIRIQMLGLLGGLWLDKQAQPIHQMGVGILVNDVPLIPFELEFQATIFTNT